MCRQILGRYQQVSNKTQQFAIVCNSLATKSSTVFTEQSTVCNKNQQKLKQIAISSNKTQQVLNMGFKEPRYDIEALKR